VRLYAQKLHGNITPSRAVDLQITPLFLNIVAVVGFGQSGRVAEIADQLCVFIVDVSMHDEGLLCTRENEIGEISMFPIIFPLLSP
jgi:hypothetical protein